MTAAESTEKSASLFLHNEEDTPVFREPWEAQAFALALRLHEQGHFSWTEWAEALSGEIAEATRRGEDNSGENYYRHWLRALESLVTQSGLASKSDLDARQQAWQRAHENTPHGEPVALANAVAAGSATRSAGSDGVGGGQGDASGGPGHEH